MENLEDSFSEDLEDLSDNDNENLDEDNGDAEHMEEDINGDLADIESLNYDDLDNVSKLQKTQRYTDIMQKVENALDKGSHMSNQGMVLEDDPEYQLVMECNTLSFDIENEIVTIYNFIRDKFRLKFPELESLVQNPIDYARVVKKIIGLEGLLPSAIIMVVSVTASTTSGKPLPEDTLQKTIEACDRALTLDSAKKKVLDFVESRMDYIAPNLSAIVGSAVAAKLMGTAGGLTSLAKMPACNVQLLGAKKKNLAGFATETSQFQVGYIEHTEVFQTTPSALKMRACRLLAEKSTLAARADSIRGDPSGKYGRTYREEIRKKIEKWQEQPPDKQSKPLPVPDSEPKKKRGSRRLRKMKGRYAIKDTRKLANRKQFGVPEESSLVEHFLQTLTSIDLDNDGYDGDNENRKLFTNTISRNRLHDLTKTTDLNEPLLNTPHYVINRKLYKGELTLRGTPSCTDLIRATLGQTKNGLEIFKSTVFGDWLTLTNIEADPLIIHGVFCHLIHPIPLNENSSFEFDIRGYRMKYGKTEFAALTGFKFGKIPEIENSTSAFKSRAFPHILPQKAVKMEYLHDLIKNDSHFRELSDEDIVRTCLLLLLCDGFEGRPKEQTIPEQFFTIVDDLDQWNRYPFGSYLWSYTFTHMKTWPEKFERFFASDKSLHKYTVMGFIYPLKIWIWETFPYVKTRFAVRNDDITPPCLAWTRVKRMTWVNVCESFDFSEASRIPKNAELRMDVDNNEDVVKSPPKKRVRTEELPKPNDPNENLLYVLLAHIKNRDRTIVNLTKSVDELTGRVRALERANRRKRVRLSSNSKRQIRK